MNESQTENHHSLSLVMMDISLAEYCYEYAMKMERLGWESITLGFSVGDDSYILRPYDEIYDEDKRLYVKVHCGKLKSISLPRVVERAFYLYNICNRIMIEFENDTGQSRYDV